MNNILIVNDWFGLLVIVVGLFLSVFIGVYAVGIFLIPSKSDGKPWYWWVYQYWINFSGMAIGWFMFFASYRYVSDVGIERVVANISFEQLIWVIVMVAGLMGFLPMAMSNLSSALKDVFDKWVGMKKTK